jgi:hypothetical protein
MATRPGNVKKRTVVFPQFACILRMVRERSTVRTIVFFVTHDPRLLALVGSVVVLFWYVDDDRGCHDPTATSRLDSAHPS